MYSSAYVWAKVLIHMEERLGAVTVSSWFDDAEVVELNDEHLILYSPSDFRREIIIRRCTEHIQDALKEIFNSNAKVIVFDDEELNQHRSGGKKNTSLEFAPQFSFENFVVGPSNRFAHGAAIAVANSPGDIYNPLFIYGPPGVGKTHLLYAIANGIRRRDPNSKIVYIKGDEFTNELIAAIQKGSQAEFKNKYRQADLMLIDDIQFIAGKESTQQEFFHTFNALYEARKQIVMTSDRKPSDMPTLEDRLRTRFEWGLLVDVAPPDFETRLAIVKNKAAAKGICLSEEIYQYIAENVTANVRQIEGTLNKAAAYQELQGMDMDQESIDRAIRDMLKKDNEYVPQPDDIIEQICTYFKVDDSVIRGTSRTADVANARQIAMYLIRRMTNLPTTTIGKYFGDRDHTTVMHSLDKVESKIKGDSEFASMIKEITTNINSKK